MLTDKIDKYLIETLTYVKVIDKKTGNTITTMDTDKFLKTMQKEFKTFKFVQDAIDFYNKHYPNHKATQEIGRGSLRTVHNDPAVKKT